MLKKSFKEDVIGMQNNLMNFAFKLTMDKDRASDLVQDTTLKALDSEAKFAENVNFKGWLFTIMRNIFINNYRRTVRESTVLDTSDSIFHVSDTRPAPETPDGIYAVSEISELIARIPADFSKPFQMHVAGYKYEEIAEILNLPLGTVKSRIFTTRTQLKALLKDYR
jgi:RNA polymerase sigma-70 factor (ECF subfamily)